FIFFFFFQAEDGIRDLTVTGVQTCALPIYRAVRRSRERERGAGVVPARELVGPGSRERHQPGRAARGSARQRQLRARGIGARLRSEERRVGKECRSRGWRDE